MQRQDRTIKKTHGPGEHGGKALLVVSFGTTHEETRVKTIDRIEQDLAAAFPDRKLYRGWTSRMIVKRLREREAEAGAGAGPVTEIVAAGAAEGSVTLTLEEALARMQEDGMTDILVQPTHIMKGAENDRMLEALAQAVEEVQAGVQVQAGGDTGAGGSPAAPLRIRTGLPLLSSEADLAQLAQILKEEYLNGENPSRDGAAPVHGAGPGNRDALVLMGHGSAKKPESNRIYHEMREAFRQIGIPDAYVGTVEGTPTFDDVLEALAGTGRSGDGKDEPIRRRVILAPMMIVAGDHAKNDMAGEEPSSWKNRLEAAGFQAEPVLRGLGEYPAVRQMLVEHAMEAQEL